ncbi:MAG: protoheme IX farnesyltransferase [Flavobacteriaceae bacterium]|nr:protoheme IX farnesyltransferase [Flavobacteriaceae bacterium]|tara:strand:+ start:4429 stop:5337 length:909 start_codon:yes stop_codon:yes gene_type:complete
MINTQIEQSKTISFSLLSFLINLMQLTKIRLSFSIVFSSIAGYFLGADKIDFFILLLLSIGGYFMAGASSIFNQLIEREKDGLMDRTKNRPLPSNRMSNSMAIILGIILSLVGTFFLYSINLETAFFSIISILIYTCIYTPLKTVTPLSVFVGAFPGAIPFMLGWVAATGEFGIEPGILFMIQFFWQFPHFWAIGWMMDDDYKKAGFKMLPSGKRDNASAFQIVFYTLWTIIISLTPVISYSGNLSLSLPAASLIIVLGFFFLFFSLKLMQIKDKLSAKKLMGFSIVYITSLQIIYVIDKFL